ncbi:MAG: hypothetical protein JNL01_10275 [Bdellovibrionales bacterium]|nr:hypothetical protein [Bdellovibrionales bacterium]
MASASALACVLFIVPGAFGVDGGGTSFIVDPKDFMLPVVRYFETKGCAVKKGQLPADSKIEERGMILKDQYSRWLDGLRREGKIDSQTAKWMIAESLGGLTARMALGTLKMTDVDAVAFIGVPHQGTPLARWTLDQIKEKTWIYRIASVVFDYDMGALAFTEQVLPEFLEKHRARFQPPAPVRIGSVLNECHSNCSAWLQVLGWIGPKFAGDGIVPTSDQRFGDDLGTFDLDHLTAVVDHRLGHDQRKQMLDSIWQWFKQGPVRSDKKG